MKPYIKDFPDYHDIKDYVESSRNSRGEQLRSMELNLTDYGWEFDDTHTGALTYFGLFYRGSRPKKKDIALLLWAKLKNRPEWFRPFEKN